MTACAAFDEIYSPTTGMELVYRMTIDGVKRVLRCPRCLRRLQSRFSRDAHIALECSAAWRIIRWMSFVVVVAVAAALRPENVERIVRNAAQLSSANAPREKCAQIEHQSLFPFTRLFFSLDFLPEYAISEHAIAYGLFSPRKNGIYYFWIIYDELEVYEKAIIQEISNCESESQLRCGHRTYTVRSFRCRPMVSGLGRNSKVRL